MSVEREMLSDVDEVLGWSVQSLHARTDRLFAWLMGVQWLAAGAMAWSAPASAWAGAVVDRWTSAGLGMLLGAVLALPCVWLARRSPGARVTRFTIAVAQLMFSSLFVHLLGGRTEAYFHTFASLAMLSFYHEWAVLIPAAGLALVDRGVRAGLLPQSALWAESLSVWRALEHAVWVVLETGFLMYACVEGQSRMRIMAWAQVQLSESNSRAERIVEERTRELEAAKHSVQSERTLLSKIVNNIPFRIYWKDREGKYLGCNEDFARAASLGSPGDIVGKTGAELPLPGVESDRSRHADAAVIASGEAILKAEESWSSGEGETRNFLASRVPLRNESDEVIGVLGIYDDVTDRKRLESQLTQAQKLESIGQLAAGIAHEINTPVQYLGDNIRFLQEQHTSLMRVVDAYSEQLAPVRTPRPWFDRAQEVYRLLEELDYEFVREEIPKSIEQSLEGLERVATIVRAMKAFSHPGSTEKQYCDLNNAIESTATVCRHRWKYAADLKLELQPGLPQVPCLVAEFNQVMLNLIVNAADAISEKFGETQKGWIRISTAQIGSGVEIRVQDNGSGISEAIRTRIFDPFFTTKGVGKGTGQGLAISRDIIVNKHGGSLDCESVPGEGTTFIICLPLQEPSRARCAT